MAASQGTQRSLQVKIQTLHVKLESALLFSVREATYIDRSASSVNDEALTLPQTAMEKRGVMVPKIDVLMDAPAFLQGA